MDRQDKPKTMLLRMVAMTALLAALCIAMPQRALAEEALGALDDALPVATVAGAGEDETTVAVPVHAPVSAVPEATPDLLPAKDAATSQQGDDNLVPIDTVSTDDVVAKVPEGDADPVVADLAEIETDETNLSDAAADDAGLAEATPEDDLLPTDEEEEATTIPAAPEDAVEVEEGCYVLQSELTGKQVVDAAGVAPGNGSNVGTWWYNKGDNQKWIVERAKETTELWYRLRLAADKTLVLAATPAENVVVAREDADDLGNLWAFLRAGERGYKLVSAAANKVLDIYDNRTQNGTNIALWYDKSKGDANQRFDLVSTEISVDASDDAGGYEGARSLALVGSGLVADIDHAKTANGADLLLWHASGATNQKMYLEPDGHGYYLVWNVNSGKVLDVDNGSILPGANVLQWERNGGDNQLWAIYQASDGSLSLRNKATGLWLGNAAPSLGASLVGLSRACYFNVYEVELLSAGIKEIHPRTNPNTSLDVRQASTANGADVLLWLDTDALNQRFELVSAGQNLWRVRTASSGGWLHDNGRGKSVTQVGSSATQGSADVWRATFRGGWYGLINERTGRALDMLGGGNGANTSIGTWDSHGGDAQHFTFDYNELLAPGYYLFQNAGGKYLDIAWDSMDNGGNAITWERNGTFGEYFIIERYGVGVRIKSAWSEKYLTAAGGNDFDNVTQQAGSGSALQQWRCTIADGGRVTFVNAASGRALDVMGASTDNGANVQVFGINGGQAQAWRPERNYAEPYTGYMLYAVRRANAARSSTGYLIVVDRQRTRTIVMTGGNGNWRPYKDFACSVGAPGSPTVTGNFTVGSRGYSFGHGYTCYYWTQIYSDYLFHSVKYYEGTRSIMDGRLNAHISAGCVRMDINNAYWIYSTIPSGTRVVIY